MSRLIGLFTTKAYAEPASETPLLGRKLRQCLEGRGLIEGSHDYKAAVALFDTFPKDELFAAPVDDLRGAVGSLLALEGTDRVRLLGRRDVDGRNASLILTLPRDRYDAALVERVRGLFRRRFGTYKVEAHHVLDDSAARRACTSSSTRPASCPSWRCARSSARSSQLSRTWDDELRDLLIERHGAGRGRGSRTAWLHRFPDHYKGYTAVELGRARHRLLRAASPRARASSSRCSRCGEQTRVGLYKAGRRSSSREAMPMLEDLGLRVIEELSTRLIGRGGRGLGAGVPRARARTARRSTSTRAATGVAEMLAAVWRGDAESDPLNRLVVTAGLDRRQLGDPARLPQVPPARRLALHRELPERRAGGQLGAHGQARALLRAALRPRAGARRGRRGRRCARRSSPTSRTSSRSTTTASCATSCG